MTIIEEGVRSFELEGDTHDVDEKTHQVVVHFPFERMDGYRSDFAKGWCDDYLGQNRPVMVVHHNPRDLIGRMIPGGYRNLGAMAEVVGKFSDFEANPLAHEYFAHIRDDEIPGWSFHYVRGRGIPHPSGVRGAVRYTKADMPEFGPTPFPAIPGAGAVGLRSEEPTLYIPTISEILELEREGHIDSEGVRALFETHHPAMVEHIKITTVPAVDDPAAIPAGVIEAIASSGLRAMTITIGDDGSVSTDGGGAQAEGSDDSETLVKAIDATLDQASSLVSGMDTTTLPDNVQQHIALVEAAGIAADELLDVLGISDPDDPSDEGTRSDDLNDLPDDAFAYIEPGGSHDDDGRTVPRKLRHFPIHNAEGVRSSLAYLSGGQSPFADEARPQVEAAARIFGIESEGIRSEPAQASAAEHALERMRSRA